MESGVTIEADEDQFYNDVYEANQLTKFTIFSKSENLISKERDVVGIKN